MTLYSMGGYLVEKICQLAIVFVSRESMEGVVRSRYRESNTVGFVVWVSSYDLLLKSVTLHNSKRYTGVFYPYGEPTVSLW